MKGFRGIALSLGLGCLVTAAVIYAAVYATPAVTLTSANSGQHFLPPFANARDRFGFDSDSLYGYDVAQLHAGWFSNWGANPNPAHPDQLVYVQLVRFNADAAPHDPGQVTVKPDRATIARIAASNPGSLWFMSNEPDSLYQGDPILPEVYAIVYHDYYEYIKGLDPTALIANGGIVQPTPCRLEYLDIVWNTYLGTYGEPMPVDVWNTHAFILREVYDGYGASTPPGVDPSCGIDYAVGDADNIGILDENIRALRGWMKEKGYQNRPLVISEYGVLWPQWFAPQYTPSRVSHFMTRTFDLFLQTTDSEFGYPADDFRLVQAWAWYSLSDDKIYNGHLFDSANKTLSPIGEAYRNYTLALSDTLYTDLSARLVAAEPTLSSWFTHGSNSSVPSVTIALTGSVSNLGKLPAVDAVARYELLANISRTVIFSQEVYLAVPARYAGAVVQSSLSVPSVAPGRHTVRLSLDPEGTIEDPRSWNNVATTTLELWPDLAVNDLVYEIEGSYQHSASLDVTVTIRNQGTWNSAAVSATVDLVGWPTDSLIDTRAFSVNALAPNGRDDEAIRFAWPRPGQQIYRLIIELDADQRLPERDEHNNVKKAWVPFASSARLVPTLTTVLTSVNGAIELVFPAGAVETSTMAYYTPLWPGLWPTAGLRSSTVAFSLTAESGDEPERFIFSRPITIAWRYGATDVFGLDTNDLQLLVLEGEREWRDAACRPDQRYPDQNRFTAIVCRTGQFVFGNQYPVYLPLLRNRIP